MQKLNINIIHDLLNEALKTKGKRALCRDIGISPTSLFNYLDNISLPTMKTIEKLSAYFNKPITYFFTGDAPGQSDNSLPPAPCSAPIECRKICEICHNLDEKNIAMLLDMAQIMKAVGDRSPPKIQPHGGKKDVQGGRTGDVDIR